MSEVQKGGGPKSGLESAVAEVGFCGFIRSRTPPFFLGRLARSPGLVHNKLPARLVHAPCGPSSRLE